MRALGQSVFRRGVVCLKIEFKKVLLYAIVPAVIAGLFSIAPKMYDVLVEPKAELTYLLSRGPELEGQDGYRMILSVEVKNSGKTPVSNVTANMALEKGTIESYKVQGDSGLKPNTIAKEGEVSVDVKKLHPGEIFTVSAMMYSQDAGITPRFSLRSTEVLGKPFLVEPEKRNQTLDVVGALLAAFSVFVMATAVMIRRKPVINMLTGSKQDFLFYIPARLNLPAISDEMRLIETRLTYLRMADILLAHGLASSGDERDKTIKALKCLLLVGSIADTSLEVIKRNIKTIEGSNYSDEDIDLLRERARSVNDLLNIRDAIDSYIEDDLEFLTSPASEKA